MKPKYYFDVGDYIEKYPDVIFYIFVGGRKRGKTYGALAYSYRHKIKHLFVKRTIEDVKMLTGGNHVKKGKSAASEYAIDTSPYVPINRDFICNIRAFAIPHVPALGAFYPCDDDNVPCSNAIGYIGALSGVSKFKGFDLSECDWMIFDEFIAARWERISHTEGEQLMNLYETISRDREHRGRDPLKVLLLANAEEISNPVFNTLEITDVVADMQIRDEHEKYIPERHILIVRVQNSEEFEKKEAASKIYDAMAGTAWASMSLGNNFAYNDFTAVKHVNLNKYHAVCRFIHNRKTYYLYNNESQWYVTARRNGKCNNIKEYNLSREMQAQAFYYDIIFEIKTAAIEDRVFFESFSLYDLFTDYKKFYKVGM